MTHIIRKKAIPTTLVASIFVIAASAQQIRQNNYSDSIGNTIKIKTNPIPANRTDTSKFHFPLDFNNSGKIRVDSSNRMRRSDSLLDVPKIPKLQSSSILR